MAIELFEAVRAAEEKAEGIVLEAQRAARELIKETEAACVDSERQMAREHRVLYQSILEEKRAAMQQTLDEEAKAETTAIHQQMQDAHQRLPQAVQCIAERVMSNGNR
ncbi:MAG: hypothetical protein GX096_10520 [Clostridiales bacterium]|nr:hypothetical protein [Clostridiales bacterium]